MAAIPPIKKKNRFLKILTDIVAVLLVFALAFWLRGIRIAHDSTPDSVENGAAYVQNRGYNPNSSNGLSDLQSLGFRGLEAKSWYVGNDDKKIYNYEVVCGSDEYRLYYAPSGKYQGWTMIQGRTIVRDTEPKLVKCDTGN
ncbi:hypothetical protein [Bifidobacterium sp. ESL0732]|uniref:hypothetical protein n=1 Tax=Bifidobacterium sp. ESL0732 TaxID=2983222 RepID=UPI0023FA35FF|nr:hypothetical protein [Bifidobacterium sp. ESL0732]WEV64284.1 hypothetical protein OZX70_01420 [Bifidobacterium sp. ESL0732]